MSGNKERIIDYPKCPNCMDYLMYWYVIKSKDGYMNGINFTGDEFLKHPQTTPSMCLKNKVGINYSKRPAGVVEEMFDDILAVRCSNCREESDAILLSQIIRIAKSFNNRIKNTLDTGRCEAEWVKYVQRLDTVSLTCEWCKKNEWK